MGGGKLAAGQEKEGGPLFKLREKIANGEEITVDDMHRLQSNLDWELKEDQRTMLGKSLRGVRGDVEQTFLDESPEFHAMMISRGLQIDHVDLDGDRSADHDVLRIGNNAVYDPLQRNGGQLVTDKNQVSDYDTATTFYAT
jgi:hypothetical protein